MRRSTADKDSTVVRLMRGGVAGFCGTKWAAEGLEIANRPDGPGTPG